MSGGADAHCARLDDLQYKGLFLYQSADLPRFTQDSVLLAGFADLMPQERAVDIGAGTGVLAVLAGARTGALFTCIEKEEALCALMRKSAAYNKMPLDIRALDWADAPRELGKGCFSAALCNPPYFDPDKPSPNAPRAAARSGENALKGATACADALLKRGGRFYLCYPAKRLTDALVALRQAGLEPKRLRFVAHNAKKEPYLALLMAVKGGGQCSLSVSPPLLLKDENDAFSEEYRAIYHMERQP